MTPAPLVGGILIFAIFAGFWLLVFRLSFAKKRRTGEFVAIGVAILALYWLFLRWEENFYLAAIPSQLETTGKAFVSGDIGFREGCGAAAFYLSDEAVQAINAQRLAFFSSATHGRGYPKPTSDQLSFEDREKLRSHEYYTYESWKETPVPRAWTSEGVWSGLGCVYGNADIIHQIAVFAKKQGSYYTTKPEGELLIIPDLKLVVLSYFG